MYKYDLGLTLEIELYLVSSCIACVYRDSAKREREKERGRCLYCNRRLWRGRRERSFTLCTLTVVLLSHSVFCSLWTVVVFPHLGFHVNICVISFLCWFSIFLCIIGSLGCGRAKWIESNPNKVVSERGLVKRYGRFVRRHVQAHRLQLLSVEVEDEGHACG